MIQRNYQQRAAALALAALAVASPALAQEDAQPEPQAASPEETSETEADGQQATDGTETPRASAEFAQLEEPASSGISEVEVPPQVTEEGDANRLKLGEATPPTERRDDPDSVFRQFSVYAKHQKARRIAGAVGGMVVGGATIGIGAVLQSSVNVDPQPWYFVGGIVIGLSAVGLLIPSPAETMARSGRVDESGHSHEEAEAFEAKWASAADRARRNRIVGGIVNLAIGAGAAGAGLAIVSGAGNMNDDARAPWGSVLIGLGAGVMGSGVVSFFYKTPLETSFDQYRAGQSPTETGSAPPALSVSLSALPTGTGLQMTGNF